MSEWDTLYCVNHPDRVALERCEVCRKPLCAYCLYYTEDGQRLCDEHADEARRRGMYVEEPGQYAEQLIGAQVGMVRKEKRGVKAEEGELYKGNSNDVTALIGMLAGIVSLTMCCGGVYCLPFVGFIASLVALLNARKSYDPKRTRRFGIIGLLFSGVWVLIIGGCIFIYGISLSTAFRNLSNPNLYISTVSWSNATPTPMPATATPTVTPGPRLWQGEPEIGGTADLRVNWAIDQKDLAKPYFARFKELFFTWNQYASGLSGDRACIICRN
jgi:hypothetical protein